MDAQAEQAKVIADRERWLAHRGIHLDPEIPRCARAAQVYRHLEDEWERRESELKASEARGDMARVRKRREMLDRLDVLMAKLWPLLHPVAMNGEEHRPDERLCRSEGCGTWFDRRQAFEQGGFCGPCWAVATGQAEPPGPADDLERTVQRFLDD